MKIRLKNDAGIVKECKVGFSWTTFFFGLFVPLLRGDIKWSIIMLLLALITCGISWLIMPFIYNKKYIINLLENGYKAEGEADAAILMNKGIITSNA